MNPTINSRWTLLCNTCQQKLINPNQPWPQACEVCGQRTHLKCLGRTQHWLVDLDIDLNPNELATVCGPCRVHAANNTRLIEQIPHASGTQLQDVYKAWKAKQPPAPPRPVSSLWGPYRVDPDNFVPAVTKVLDIVHSAGPKIRWAVKLAHWDHVPMTRLSSKEIILPNYFDSPNALGRTHQEILDAMTGAAMHEAGHAAYDSADTITAAQKHIKPGPQESTWAAAMCLNIVCDYNLERKVLERYPAFRHYFSECHRWSVRDTLPNVVKALQEDGAEDKLNIRLALVVWEMLGPGDIARAGGTITPKLQWILDKCFSILKYAYTKGLLNTEPGKLKTARAIYELCKVITPVGAPNSVITIPQPPQGGQGPTIGGFPGQPGQGGQQGQPQDDQDADDDEQQGTGGSPSDQESEDTDDDAGMRPGTSGSGSVPTGTGADAQGASEDPSGDPGEEQEMEGGGPAEDEDPQDAEGQGDRDADGNGAGSDPGSDGHADPDNQHSTGGDDEEEPQEEAQGHNDDDGQPGIADNTSPEGEDAGDPGQPVGDTPSNKGGQSGSESPPDPANDPFTGRGDLQDDPSRRKNARKDALDDLAEENQGESKIDEKHERPLGDEDTSFNKYHREKAEKLNDVPEIQHREVAKEVLNDYLMPHQIRTRHLAPIISRLKKILKFRNVDWGGRQTGRRSGTLTRRHVARLSALGNDKVFHKTQPDQTPKVRIAVLVDESESMNHKTSGQSIEAYIAAKNAATALTAALHGIRGVKLWCWGYSMQVSYRGPGKSGHVPFLRPYVDPYHNTNPVSLEAPPMSGGTPTGEAMDYAASVLTKNASPDERKVVFIITDGEAGGYTETATAVRKWTGKVTFVHIGIGATRDDAIPFYVGPVTDVALLPDLLSESAREILT